MNASTREILDTCTAVLEEHKQFRARRDDSVTALRERRVTIDNVYKEECAAIDKMLTLFGEPNERCCG